VVARAREVPHLSSVFGNVPDCLALDRIGDDVHIVLHRGILANADCFGVFLGSQTELIAPRYRSLFPYLEDLGELVRVLFMKSYAVEGALVAGDMINRDVLGSSVVFLAITATVKLRSST
jgi:hypothetical protein